MTQPTDASRDGRAGVRSRALMQSAQTRIPGGVNSPVRAFAAVGGAPPFVQRALGPHVWTEDGVRLIDYIGSWGPMILGHAHPEVIEAVVAAAKDGLSFGAQTAREGELAELVCTMVPSLRDGMVRLCNSGTEATMSALRVARGFTGRDKIVKTDGAYHGHADILLVAAGSGAATLGIPGSAGVPDGVVADTLLVPWNDIDAIEALVRERGDEIAAIIVEPVVGNMGCVPPRPGYLQRLREITAQAGIVLVFDEVMTGFRLARGGAQELYGVVPDMTTLGKIVGGGMPIGVYGGRAEIMARVAPLGPVYQAGTLSGNPVAVAAGLATLRVLERDPPWTTLERRASALHEGLVASARRHGLAWTLQRVGSMFTGFFQAGEVWSYDDAKKSDTKAFAAWHAEMLARGIYLPPSQYEAAFLSIAHDDAVIEQTLAAADAAFAAIAL
ncbi:MAG TPA: glutamate-1-semialdehyde 2,1-aminomutase [Nannocystaceae bacterium]|nr:glutamate-1-semialdehyde 2,1-aminomutase [Nannocystaceae bacterium]